ncbi:MAG TPA: DUF4397 domain-containing protein [Kangiella sp.]
MKLKHFLIPFLVLPLIACNDDDDNDPIEEMMPQSFKVQVVHASQDSPDVNVSVNGSETLSDVAYKQASSRLTLDEGTYTLQVDGITPNGDTTVIGPLDVNFSPDQLYTVLAVNQTASIEPLVISQADFTPADGELTIQVIHAASNAPTVDIYLTEPDADISGVAPTTTLSFKDSLSATDIPAGDYQIRVTPAGDSTVVFDSGTVSLTAGVLLNVAAVANTTTGDSPISLLAIADDGATEILDANTPADFRVFHVSADAPNVDVVINDDFANPVVVDLAFPDYTDYLSVPEATYNAKVVPTGANTPVVIDADLALEAGSSYSVLAVNNSANIEPLVLADTRRAISTEAQLRVVHGSPSAGNVDIYLIAPGTDINDVQPSLSDVPFKAETGYLSVAEGDYDVVVTTTGTKTATIGPAAITLSNGGIYTIIARDNPGGGAPLNVILADDFVP